MKNLKGPGALIIWCYMKECILAQQKVVSLARFITGQRAIIILNSKFVSAFQSERPKNEHNLQTSKILFLLNF